ncbi:MAG: HD domain-containing protein [Clostridiaceae bacterium]|nr:HD domain-containing protein [Clostridiaceae bacterium]
MKKTALNECKWGDKVELILMIKKILDKSDSMIWAYCGDKNKEVKCIIKYDALRLEEGNVVKLKGTFAEPFKVDLVEKIEEYDIKDFLPQVKRPIDEIMDEIETITNKEIVSAEGKMLNNYFFNNEHFIEKFRMAIGGVFNHHNYLGGLAEHTLGVMKLTQFLAYNYDLRYKEIAILGAKLHDIGKVYEMRYDGPFKYTLKGSMQGHIVMGVQMIEKAFVENSEVYNDIFKERIKGIIVQHHGKLEYGSPIAPRSQEAFAVHYADYVDAAMNKVNIISEGIDNETWSNYDTRIEGRLFL